MSDPHTVLIVGRVFMVICAVAATLFPIMYSRSPWYRSSLGQAVMAQAVALAALCWLRATLSFARDWWSLTVIRQLNTTITAIITIAILAVCYQLFFIRRAARRKELGMADHATGVSVSDKFYDILKPTTAVVLPGLATLYAGLALIWGFPNPDAVVGSVALVNTFLGGLLVLSSRTYKASEDRFDGGVKVLPGEEGDKLAINIDPAAIAGKDELTLKVTKDIPPQ